MVKGFFKVGVLSAILFGMNLSAAQEFTYVAVSGSAPEDFSLASVVDANSFNAARVRSAWGTTMGSPLQGWRFFIFQKYADAYAALVGGDRKASLNNFFRRSNLNNGSLGVTKQMTKNAAHIPSDLGVSVFADVPMQEIVVAYGKGAENAVYINDKFATKFVGATSRNPGKKLKTPDGSLDKLSPA